MASIFKTADGSWRAQVRRKGLPSVSQNFPSKVEAQRWAREQEHRLDSGNGVPIGLKTTVADVVDAYLSAAGEKSMSPTKRRILQMWRREYGARRLAEMNKQVLLSFATARTNEGVRPATVAQDLAFYKTALRFGGPLLDAEEQSAIALVQLRAAYDVLKHLGKVGVSRKRSRRPSDEEYAALLAYFDSRPISKRPISDIILFAAATTMRLGEIVGRGGLRWADLNVKERTILVRQRKHPTEKEKNDDLVPLLKGPCVINGQVIDPLEILLRQERRGPVIWPFTEFYMSNLFAHACELLKIEDLHFHDIRHDAISRLFEAGYQIPEVAVLSGHKDWKNLKRYTQIKPHTLHRSNAQAPAGVQS